MYLQKLIKSAKLKIDAKGKVPSPNIEKKDKAKESEYDNVLEVSVQNKRERGDGTLPSMTSKKPVEKKD